ncbi:hypothetical protein K437DRAFT_221056 [Tilletiaria anomala UBC 951]|uniref:Amino acid transporter transmembrane domain-containing protein n=1 Tax=Tilletiaria anomala (strain ATCC 24038 / CBS 436.72 / UBC 951) TaxID=1037660 RepID=A0A066WNS1_TILAU|nr:uncharacterized protein K437DRAFT_221056 [Tilletiaria anomala UBC 951]KDN52260.1 hypothetical protein K437DRAFT_221056 [Tilletiaria anomala UBC 951]
MSWQRTAALLFGEYVCLAILAVPSSFAVLGMAGGILTVLGIGLVTLYTSLTLWQYCLKYPEQLNIAEIGGRIFSRTPGGFSRTAFELTAIILLLNNIFLMGLHTLTGAEIINTLVTSPGSGWCSVALSVIVMVLCAVATLPRQLNQVAVMGIASAASMAISILLVLIFTGIQGRHPAGVDASSSAPVLLTVWAPEGITFVEGFNAALSITFLWIGQITYPTFIAEMRDPREFPKALYALTAVEFLLFSLVGIFVYAFCGQYTGAPAVIVLAPTYKKIAFAFVFPTTVIIGVIYASVAAKYIFARIFAGTKHYDHHTTLGWAVWIAVVFAIWLLGWVVGESIPFFGSLISLMSALFDSFIGFIFWTFAYLEIKRGQLWKGQPLLRKAETLFNCALVPVGIFMLGPGTYTSVQAIIDSYATGAIKAPFGCTSNAV